MKATVLLPSERCRVRRAPPLKNDPPRLDLSQRRKRPGRERNNKRLELCGLSDSRKVRGKIRGKILTTNNTSTIRLHRVLQAPPERVYRAFLDANAMVKWLPPNGFTGQVHHLEARVGGTYKMSFTNFTTGKSHSFGGEYLELTPNELILHTDRFDDPNLPGEMQTKITLKQGLVGTELSIVQEGVPAVIPAEACYLGWQESLTLLAQLVEADIPDQS